MTGVLRCGDSVVARSRVLFVLSELFVQIRRIVGYDTAGRTREADTVFAHVSPQRHAGALLVATSRAGFPLSPSLLLFG